jgi:hypothetical protein
MPKKQDLRTQAIKIATGLYPHQVDGVAFLMSRRHLSNDRLLDQKTRPVSRDHPHASLAAACLPLSGFLFPSCLCSTTSPARFLPTSWSALDLWRYLVSRDSCRAVAAETVA